MSKMSATLSNDESVNVAKEQAIPASTERGFTHTLPSGFWHSRSAETKGVQASPATKARVQICSLPEDTRDTAKDKTFHPVPAIIGKRRKKAKEYNQRYHYADNLSHTQISKLDR